MHLLYALFCIVFLAQCSDNSNRSTDTPDDPQLAWMLPADPDSLGFSPAKLAEAQAFSEQIGSAAVLVLYDGHIIAAWGETERKYLAHSIRKSLLGALYGIHVEEGTGYGYLWWTIADGSYAALGYGGHWVHVIPDEKLVIVHRADTDNEQTVSTPDYIALQTMIREARSTTAQTPLVD